MKRPFSGAASWLLWLGGVAALTGGMALLRAQLDRAHIALAYLLLVLAGSARGTRTRGAALALLCFLCFNFFFLPPYGTLVIARPLDWLVLFTFLAVAGVAAQLLYRVRVEADEARRRADEINRLATLGAETLNVGRAEDAVLAIAEVIRTTVGVRECTIELPVHDDAGGAREGRWTGSAAALAAGRRVAVAELRNGATRLVPRVGTDAHEISRVEDAIALALPLYVGGRVVGVLRVADARGVTLTASQRRIFAALSYYAALGAERVRLVAEEEHAAALREADRLKDALIATVSHDLRTPLTTIKALAHEVAAEGDHRAVVIEEEADRLNHFVANLLDMSRLNAGELPLTLEAVAVEDLLGAALQRVSGSVGKREIRVDLGPPDPLILGRMDFVQALRVVANLLENADKYSPRDQPIDLSAAREGEWVVIRVADRGPGIPQEERERIFQPFYRQAGAQPDVGGTGLGLSIARRTAEAQGGSLVCLDRPGGGSVFAFSLPAAELPQIL